MATKLIIKLTSLLIIVLISSNVGDAEGDKPMYTTKYDNIDIDGLLKNDRLLKNYVGCLMDENPCTPDATELKKNLPDALATNCSSCSEAQKNIAEKMYHHLIDNKPDDWSRLEAKYDPSGHYRKTYLNEKTETTTTVS